MSPCNQSSRLFKKRIILRAQQYAAAPDLPLARNHIGFATVQGAAGKADQRRLARTAQR